MAVAIVPRVGIFDLDQKGGHLVVALPAFDGAVRLEVAESSLDGWQIEKMSDYACYYQGYHYGQIWPDQNCYQDVLKGGIDEL